MNAADAKKILRQTEMLTVTKTDLYSLGWYLAAEAGRTSATLDGEFSADELEAIACWMREPFEGERA